MRVEKAGFADVDALTAPRLEYLIEDNGSLEHSDAETIRNNLPGYIREHLKKDLFAYVIREDDIIVYRITAERKEYLKSLKIRGK